MRLIDADALKKEFTEGAFTTRGVREIIDNAPTVEERPKGKWIKHISSMKNGLLICTDKETDNGQNCRYYL